MSGQSILIVEDEPEIREMLSFSLTRAGYEVWETETAEQAMARLDGATAKPHGNRLDVTGPQRS